MISMDHLKLLRVIHVPFFSLLIDFLSLGYILVEYYQPVEYRYKKIHVMYHCTYCRDDIENTVPYISEYPFMRISGGNFSGFSCISGFYLPHRLKESCN